jgi:predicted TIM-barrel fold metal-dependent hydrolase
MMNRKRFLKSASLMTVASFAGRPFLSSDKKSSGKLLPIIDTHQHLCDFERFKVGWCTPPLPRNFNMEDYLEAVDGLNVIKSVYVEVGVAPENRRAEALYSIELCKDSSNPMVGAVIGADIGSADFEEYMSEFKNSPYIKGIRSGFRSSDELLNEQVVKNMRILGSMNFSFEFSLSPKWLPQMAELTGLCPNTLFIVEHCGRGDPQAFYKPWQKFLSNPELDQQIWLAGMEAISSKKNTACKISNVVTQVLDKAKELIAKNLAPVINECFNFFGPDRVMFAGDWPWVLKKVELANWVNILKEVIIKRSDEDQKKLFFDNALTYYRIKE